MIFLPIGSPYYLHPGHAIPRLKLLSVSVEANVNILQRRQQAVVWSSSHIGSFFSTTAEPIVKLAHKWNSRKALHDQLSRSGSPFAEIAASRLSASKKATTVASASRQSDLHKFVQAIIFRSR
jgi:hypothetical protein